MMTMFTIPAHFFQILTLLAFFICKSQCHFRFEIISRESNVRTLLKKKEKSNHVFSVSSTGPWLYDKYLIFEHLPDIPLRFCLEFHKDKEALRQMDKTDRTFLLNFSILVFL